MSRILICIRDDGTGNQQTLMTRARMLRAALGNGWTVDMRPMHVDEIGTLAAFDCDAIVAVGYQPAEVAAFGVLAIPCVWDFGLIAEEDLSAWLESAPTRADLQKALVAVRSVCEMPPACALRIEDELTLGITPQSVDKAVSACLASVAVVLGAGLGNMIYGVGMVRWISEQVSAPVDLIIHDRFDQAVALFANASCLNAVYSGFDYIAGQHYKILVSSITAGGVRSLVSADKALWLEQDHSYNEEGRFLPEPQLNFLGLEKLFGSDPVLTADIPMPFLRDIHYTPPGKRVVGVAHGKKSGAWAKREWPHMESFVQRLVKKGWTVRSFGLPDEYVEGAEDHTHLSMRDCVYEIANCDYFVSHDGGMCHIAEGLGVPTIWLFGSTGSVKNGPVYAHSRTLNTMPDCGPCMYKADWLRCEVPICMSDLSVEQVLSTLDELHREISEQGYNPQPLVMDDALLRYEIQALYRPAQADARELAETERYIALPRSGPLRLRIAIGLLQSGDIAGFAAHVADISRMNPDNAMTRFLNGLVSQGYGYPVPVAQTAHSGAKPLTPECNAELIAELERLNLTPQVQRFFVETGLKYWLQEKSTEGALGFVNGLLNSVPFNQNFQRPLQRFAERLLVETENDLSLNVQFHKVPSLSRMRRILQSTPEELFHARAKRMAQELAEPEMDAERLLSETFAPYFNAAQTYRLEPLRLDLNGQTCEIPPHSTILMIVPHVKIKDSTIGSMSSLVVHHAERLAALGMRAVVVTTGFDDIPPGIEMRDSVSFMQAHRRWPGAYWDDVKSFFDPALTLAYAGIEQLLPLSPEFMRDTRPVAVHGLTDNMGFAIEFEADNPWGMTGPVPGSNYTSDSIDANTLSAHLVLPALRQANLTGQTLDILVILTEPGDFMPMTELAAALPSVNFTVVCGFVHRGIEKNLFCMSYRDLTADRIAEASCVMQFSTRPQTLLAVALDLIETGKTVIAPVDPETAPELARHVVAIKTPERLGDWTQAVTALARKLLANTEHVASA